MSRNDTSCESWAPWHEDSFKLDSPPAAAISRSLWDEIPQHETAAAAGAAAAAAAAGHSLFESTPATEIASVMLSSLSHQDFLDPHCSEDEGGADCPLHKRRRMLLFPQADEGITDCGEMKNAASWYLNAADESFTSFEQQQQQQQQHCAAQESWMTSWINSDPEEQNHKRCIQVADCHTASEISAASAAAQEAAAQRSSRSSFAASNNRSPSVTGRRSSSGSSSSSSFSRSVGAAARPVAYPFALLKPCGATGDVTLSDINQRIQTRPSQIRRLNVEASPEAGAGLSGKSVVALTKIHTEGNGSITIMRTKG